MVAMLHSYISDRFCEGLSLRVLSDSGSRQSANRPPSIGGYIPDAYVMINEKGTVVLGEAKSMKDLEHAHTVTQLTAFLERCAIADGSALILAVPWPTERLARALLKKLQARQGSPHVETVVLSDANKMGTTL